MKREHPAITAYKKVWQDILENKDDAGLMPQGSGDIVGRARHEAEMKKRGIPFPENFIEQFQWWEKIGGVKACKPLTRKFWRIVKERRAQQDKFVIQ